MLGLSGSSPQDFFCVFVFVNLCIYICAYVYFDSWKYQFWGPQTVGTDQTNNAEQVCNFDNCYKERSSAIDADEPQVSQFANFSLDIVSNAKQSTVKLFN